MENLDLNKYQLAWKNIKSFQAEKLSEMEILNFMRSASKIAGQYKRALLFDIVLKGVLLVSFLVLLFLLKSQSNSILAILLFSFITVFGIFWQIKSYKGADKISITKEHLKDLLRAYIDFYNGQYIKAIFFSALSSTLLFLSSSLFYLYFKYNRIPTFELDDFIVLTIGIVLSYGGSAFVQIKQNDFQIKQLESCLVEIEEDTINEITLKKVKSNRIKNLFTIGIALIIGVILLLFMFYKLTNNG